MPQLSIVVPTFNELGNVTELRDRIAAALPGVDWELIYVDDDSPDGTAEQLVALAQQDRRVRCMLRIGRRGLASACIEGLLAASSPLVAVIDADLQHDETQLPRMVELLRDPELPDVLLPSDWPGQKARLLCKELYRRLLAPSERHLDAHFQLASGQTPPASRLIHERFREDDPLAELA